MPLRLSVTDPDFETAFLGLLKQRLEIAADVDDGVAEIIARVKKDGDRALIELTARHDRFETDTSGLRITAEEQAAAKQQCDPDDLEALRLAAGRIEAFHRRQMPKDIGYTDHAGVFMGNIWGALKAVGIYVPGGSASYPSSVLMTAIPARVAGAERIVMTVPTPGGRLSPLVLAAADIAGVTEIYRIGGAQAIAALAHGTQTIAPVDKIAGPGNAYVASAKRQLFGVVGIDMIAGPSEIVVVSDNASDPAWIAADLLAQAEHGEDAQAILLTDDQAFADQVADQVEAQLATLERAAIAGQSWRRNGALIVLENLGQAPVLIDRIAPEHLELAVEDPERLAAMVRNAGAIFLGRFTPEAVGDYVAGPSHVLPTAGSARYSSGLSVYDFLKRTSVMKCDETGLAAIGPAAHRLARAEGLEGHARSIAARLRKPPDS